MKVVDDAVFAHHTRSGQLVTHGEYAQQDGCHHLPQLVQEPELGVSSKFMV
jgi:hypothetical protein